MSRRTEVLIGRLLGAAIVGSHHSIQIEGREIDKSDRRIFRLLAKWEPVVEEMIVAGKPERNAILKEIDERERQSKRPMDLPPFDLRMGDFRIVLADLEGVDAVITDPPYERHWIDRHENTNDSRHGDTPGCR